MPLKQIVLVVLAVIVAAVQSFELALSLESGDTARVAVKAVIVALCLFYLFKVFRARKGNSQDSAT